MDMCYDVRYDVYVAPHIEKQVSENCMKVNVKTSGSASGSVLSTSMCFLFFKRNRILPCSVTMTQYY